MALFYILVLLLTTSLGAYGEVSKENNKAFFIFGDSVVDAGNNNYIDTITEFQANFKPYGQNWWRQTPTGRFCDGRLMVDYIADYAKLPIIPPFMGKNPDFIHGANFASGGGGVLPDTNKGKVINLPTQLENFDEVQETLIERVGEAQANAIISEAVYFISIGPNDYIGGYLLNPETKAAYKPEDYAKMVVGNLTKGIQHLYNRGARKFGFLSIFPLGCLPFFRNRYSNFTGEEGCIEEASVLALEHNKYLKQVVTTLGKTLTGFEYSYFNFYGWLNNRVKNPSKYGFKDGAKACCGTGNYNGIYSCGGQREPVKEYEVCENANDRIWWDSFHFTQRLEEQLADDLWSGHSNFIGHTIEELFCSKKKKTIASDVDVPQGT